jgi:hypothetical protein
MTGGDEAIIRAAVKTHFVDSYEHFIQPEADEQAQSARQAAMPAQ